MKGSTKKVAFGAIIAALAGYITGILTAPKSGKETRKDIQKGALKAKTEAEKQLKKMHSELNDLLEQTISTAKHLKKNAGEEFANVVSKAQFAKDKAREILSAVHEGNADDEDLKKAIEQVKESIKNLKTYLAKNKPNAKNTK